MLIIVAASPVCECVCEVCLWRVCNYAVHSVSMYCCSGVVLVVAYIAVEKRFILLSGKTSLLYPLARPLLYRACQTKLVYCPLASRRECHVYVLTIVSGAI